MLVLLTLFLIRTTVKFVWVKTSFGKKSNINWYNTGNFTIKLKRLFRYCQFISVNNKKPKKPKNNNQQTNKNCYRGKYY